MTKKAYLLQGMLSLMSVYAIMLTLIVSCTSSPIHEVIVSPSGNDHHPGTREQPVQTLIRALARVGELKRANGPQVKEYHIKLQDGYYVLDETMRITPEVIKTDSLTKIMIQGEGKAIFSGAERIRGWEEQEGNLWKVYVGAKRNINQLFADGERKKRARTPNEGFLLTKGPLTPYADRINTWTDDNRFPKKHQLKKAHFDAFCGFAFEEGDLGVEPDWKNAEVLVYHSWEASWHSVSRVDTLKKDLWFHTPSNYPIGFFKNRTRYVVENIRSAMDQPGEWYYDYFGGILYYLAEEGENVPAMDFFAPKIQTLMVITGTETQPIQNLHFRNIGFQHSQGVRGFYSSSPSGWKDTHAVLFPGVSTDFRPGYTDSQAAPHAGEAVHLSFAARLSFDACTFNHLGAYGLAIEKGSRQIEITRNQFKDLGAGGILIGLPISLPYKKGNLTYETAPQNLIISHNVIKEGGIFYKSAVGIWMAQTHHNEVSYNELSRLPYSGISCGWTWSDDPNFTNYNSIYRNTISHVMQELDDGGGIYTLGSQPGTVIAENVIHDIFRDERSIGSHNNGLFFDERSSGFTVKDNYIFNIQDEPIRFNQSKPEDLSMTNNSLGNEHLPEWYHQKQELQ